MNLCLDYLQMANGRSAGVAQFRLEQFQVYHYGVDGILDLVTHAPGQPANRRHAPGEFKLRLDFFSRLRIMEGDQRAQSFPGVTVVNQVQ